MASPKQSELPSQDSAWKRYEQLRSNPAYQEDLRRAHTGHIKAQLYLSTKAIELLAKYDLPQSAYTAIINDIISASTHYEGPSPEKNIYANGNLPVHLQGELGSDEPADDSSTPDDIIAPVYLIDGYSEQAWPSEQPKLLYEVLIEALKGRPKLLIYLTPEAKIGDVKALATKYRPQIESQLSAVRRNGRKRIDTKELPKTHNEVIALRMQRVPVRDIAQRVGLSISRVNHILSENGLTRPRKNSKK